MKNLKKVFIYLFVFLFAAGSSFTAKITPVKASESNPIEQNDVLEEDLFVQDESEQAIAKESLIPEFSSELTA